MRAALLAIAICAATAGIAGADRPPPQALQGEGFEANKKFGLGLELGEPVGLNGKVFLSPTTALDFGIGDLYHPYYVGAHGLHLYLDHLWHPLLLTKAAAFELPLYIGVGGRMWTFDYSCDRFGNCSGAQLFGVRVPIGISFDFNHVPLDIFLQFVPTLDFYRNYNYQGGRTVYPAFDFSGGIRFWFF